MVLKRTTKRMDVELAHQELIQRPRNIAHCWAPILRELEVNKPFKTPSIIEFFSLRTPTARKVLRVINCNPSSHADRQCFDFLKKFIRSLDASALETFSKFITGSDSMPSSSGIFFLHRWVCLQTHSPHLWTTFGVASHIPVLW